MHLFGLHIIDVIIVVASLIGVIALGFWVSRGVKHENDFFAGNRRIGGWLQFFMNFGGMADSNNAPIIATEVFRQGVGGMWIGFQLLLATPFYWFTSIWFRRTRLITFPELFVDRFNAKLLPVFYSLLSLLVTIASMAMGNVISYKVASAMIVKPATEYTSQEHVVVAEYREYVELKKLKNLRGNVLTPSQQERFSQLDSLHKKGQIHSYISYIQPIPFYIAYALIVAAYVTMGGLKAAAMADAFQGVLIIFFSVMLIPLGLNALGGFSGLHDLVPEYKFRIFGTVALSDYTWYSVLAVVVATLINVIGGVGPVAASARDEVAARIGVLGGGFAKRLLTIAWMFTGLLAIGLFPDGISDPDHAWGAVSHRLLGPGFMGIMIAGMLIGHMPAVGMGVVVASAQFTRNIYEPLLRGRSPAHYLFAAKLFIPLLLGVSIVATLALSGVIQILSAIITYNTYMGATAFLIYFWRRLSGRAILVGMILWLFTVGLLPWCLPLSEGFRRIPALTLQTAERTVFAVSGATTEDVAAGLAKSQERASEKHT